MKNIFGLAIAIIVSTFSYAQTLNEAQGTGSGQSITSGDYNTFYGDSSASAVSSGSLNTIIGYKAGFFLRTALDNVFIGAGAGGGSTTGTDNVVIGTKAGGWGVNSPNNSGTLPTGAIGTDNVVIGTEAGMVMQTGASDNTIIGEEAGQALVDGDDNVFIGEDAGYNSTTSSDNTFVGNQSGRTNTTGFRNAFFGNSAGYDNSTGYWNTAVGDSAGIDNSVGIGNTMIGHAAGAATEYASYNTFIGHNAGWDNNRTNGTSGEALHNTYLGANTGFTNREGNYNVGLGAFADFRSLGYTNSNDNVGNVFIGYESMVDERESIAIGYFSRVYGRGTVAIGAFSDYDYNSSDYSVGLGWTGHANNATSAIGIGRQHYLQNADNSIGIGAYDSITADYGMAIGYSANSSANYASSFGYESSVGAENSMAFGHGATIDDPLMVNSIAMGHEATATDSNAMILGNASNPLRLGIGTTAPNAHASIDLAETTKGFMMNRLTNAERATLGSSLAASEEGLVVFDTEDDQLYAWDGSAWVSPSFAEVDGDITNEIQDISLSGTDLTISSGSTIDLSGIDTDTQLTEAEVDAFVANNGYLTSFTEVDGDATNEIQDISLSGTDLTITSGSTIDLSGIDTDTDTQLTEAEVDAFVANNGYITSPDDADADPTNEIQDISLAGGDLTISSGSTIDLSGIDTDTDTQLTEAEVDAFVANNGYITSPDDADADPTNEIQDISLAGGDLTISSGSTIDLSGINTDTQLTEAEVDAFVANNGYITSPDDADADPTNEIQDISLSGTDLTISSGSTLDLSGIDTDTDEQDLTAATLTGTTLQIDIENGASVSVDLAPLLTDLQNQINDLDLRVTELEACACDTTVNLWENGSGYSDEPILYQNIPNPFNNTSSIKYYIPSWANSANIVISDGMGQIVSNISLFEVGSYGTAHVNADGLAAATYYYTLYVDKAMITTKKMVVE